MKRTIGAVAALALSAGLAWAAVRAQEGMPEMPKPEKEHEFLKKFEGTWESVNQMRMAGDQKWMESKSADTSRMIGDFWLITESKGDMMPGMPFEGLGSTGYDKYKKKYVSTWVDSINPTLNVGEGTLDAAGKVMTTTMQGTDCESGKPCTMRMTQEFKDNDTLVWSMYMKGKDGQEFEAMKAVSKRKK
jgi:hypothetical protein